jgi:two-component system C4-dicarboxylate transport response regulator DctD
MLGWDDRPIRMYSSTPPPSLRVLVADDDDDMLAFVTATLLADGCSTVEAHDGEQLLDLLRNALGEPNMRPDVIVADVKMPGLSGLGVLAALRRTTWALPVVLITAAVDASIHVVARRLGAVGVLHKPFDPDDLLTAVRNAKSIRALHGS